MDCDTDRHFANILHSPTGILRGTTTWISDMTVMPGGVAKSSDLGGIFIRGNLGGLTEQQDDTRQEISVWRDSRIIERA